MRTIVITLIFAAVILAGGTAYLLRNYLSSQEAEFASRVPKAPTSDVLIAASDMPPGTVVNDKNVEWMPWPEDALQDHFIVRTRQKNPLNDIVKSKHVTRFSTVRGEPIIMSKLYKSENPGFLSGSITPGMRAVAVRSTAETAASGFILPGDRIDVVLTHDMLSDAMTRMTPQEPQRDIMSMEYASETILENLLVLAVDQKVNEFETGAVVSKTILLEVTPKQAEIINTARSMGNLALVLRSAEIGEDPRTDRSFTTDFEVSPAMSSYERIVNGEIVDESNINFMNGQEQTDFMNTAPAPMSSNATSNDTAKQAPTLTKPKATLSPSTPPNKSSNRKIRIYRGTGESGAGANLGRNNNAAEDGAAAAGAAEEGGAN